MADEQSEKREPLVSDIYPLLNENGQLHVDRALLQLENQQLRLFNQGLATALQQKTAEVDGLKEPKSPDLGDASVQETITEWPDDSE